MVSNNAYISKIYTCHKCIKHRGFMIIIIYIEEGLNFKSLKFDTDAN